MISVCLATYNGAEYIREQIESILAQLSAEDEIVVSDGGSTDDTMARIRQIGDARIRVLTLPEAPAVSNDIWGKMALIRRNFEHALQHAQGDIVFLSDQDDKWLPGKVAGVLDVMDEQTMCVVHDAIVTDEQLHEITPSIMNLYRPCYGRWGVLWKSPFMGCCMAVRKAVVTKALPMPDGMEYDTWLGCVAFRLGKVKFVKTPWLLYRRHGHNASCLADTNPNSLFVKFRRRYNMLKSCLLYLRS